MPQCQLNLQGFQFAELFSAQGLARLDESFLVYLQAQDANTHDQLLAYRQQDEMSAKQISQLLLDCAPWLEKFMAQLFDIEDSVSQLQAK